MNKFWNHFKTVCKHKHYVFKECAACGILWQGIVHDLSKFSREEFLSSVKYYQGDRSPIEAEKEAIGYSKAWLHHKGRNKHHWEYWTDFNSKTGEIITNKIPDKYAIEMICDWVGAGKAYMKDKWDQSAPLNYYEKVKNGRHFHPETEELLVDLLKIIDMNGLEAFHDCCKSILKKEKKNGTS